AALAQMSARLSTLPRTTVPLARRSLLGIESLRNMGGTASGTAQDDESVTAVAASATEPTVTSLRAIVDELAQQHHGVVLTMGKGGVGKTSVAAAVAIGLANKGLQVHLTTTDPAGDVTMAVAEDAVANLSVSRIDPAKVTAAYREEVMHTAGAELDDVGRALLDEDLRSPCTEEIAVFRAFAEAVAAGEDKLVVLDTAPTGHTILLLDSALAYHREVTRQATRMPEFVENLLPRLRDPDFTRILVVTLPESTPVHEAAKLQDDLRRAAIEPFAWVVNQSLTPLDVTDRILVGRQRAESPLISEVVSQYARRTAIIPWLVDSPSGLSGLQLMIR
ncbi:MAG: AAA family ATPase, partial [Planctomycetales bacterium]|nr:AAA family ATPase [Planctomycetales bacterium]